jgi:predicted RNase H-like HicB family nuclease
MTGTLELFVGSIDGKPTRVQAEWTSFDPGSTYECRIAIVQESDGYSAHAMNLPGAISQGDTIAEALENVTEACRGVLREYIDMGRIPWSDVEIGDPIVAERRILVNV